MNRKRVFIMGLVMVFNASVVYTLFEISKPVKGGNGFKRSFSFNGTIAPVDTLDIEFDSYYLAGETNHHVYLGNLAAPRHLLVVDCFSLDTQHIQLEIDNPERLKFWSLKLKVDSPFFYMTDGTVPAIFKGKLNDRRGHLLQAKLPYFIGIEQMSLTSFAVRSLSRAGEGQLGKVGLSPPVVEFPKNLLVKQIDGVFCTDGMLHYEQTHARLIYLYFYRNEYLVMDSSLRLMYKGRTIDTTTRAKLQVATINSESARTFSAPPILVNRRSLVHGTWLYVNSNLQSDNEAYRDFDEASVVDVYNLDSTRHNYLFSFYIPLLRGSKLRDFVLLKDRLFVLYERNAVIYVFRDGKGKI